MTLHYPDNGEPLGDRAVLRSAVQFTTSQRAYRAARVLREPVDRVSPLERAFLAVEAFDLLAVSLEDLTGWLFVLRDWQPGSRERSLFTLLDTVQVGRLEWTEEEALRTVRALQLDGYRRLAHVPSRAQLLGTGWSRAAADGVEAVLRAQLEGFARAVERRASNHRALVRAYNKSKHMLLGMLREKGSGYQVELLTAVGDGRRLCGSVLECSNAEVQSRATEAVQAQAVLNSLLSLVLWTRYGERRPTPQWVVSAYRLLEVGKG